MIQLKRVARNVADIEIAANFYEAIGFTRIGSPVNDPSLAALLEVEIAASLNFRLGAQTLELTQCTPLGASYPATAKSDDILFQHIAIRTRDIAIMRSRALQAGAIPISCNGPQLLPKEAGGVIAWKFRDPEGHPLEFLEMPAETSNLKEALISGYDHSAICVADIERSIIFYQTLGLTLKHRHLNRGTEQAQLDGLEVGHVEVVAMAPTRLPPHVELLAYPRAIISDQLIRPHDIAADRLVFSDATHSMSLQHDPDGHVVLLDNRP